MGKKVSTNLREDGTLEIFIGEAILAEISDCTEEQVEEMTEDVLYEHGYDWIDGEAVPMKGRGRVK